MVTFFGPANQNLTFDLGARVAREIVDGYDGRIVHEIQEILTVEPDEVSRAMAGLRKRCDNCGGIVPIPRAAVAMARGHARRYCSDPCGDRDRNRRAYARRTAPIPPPVKWAGSKRWAIDRFRRHYRYHRERRLVEPFAGSAAVALGLRPRYAHLHDASAPAMAFFRRLADGFVLPDSVATDRDRETYFAQRDRFNERIAAGIVDDDETASLWLYLAKACFNGRFQLSRAGKMNTSWGGEGIPIARDWRGYAAVMRGWTFSTGDFADVRLDPEDFVFADPPYYGTWDGYTAERFSWHDQVRLAEWLAAHPGPTVATNAYHPKILDLYRSHGFRVRRSSTPRSGQINADGDARRGKFEMIATRNTDAWDAAGDVDDDAVA
jgi:DNA adenine methylase